MHRACMRNPTICIHTSRVCVHMHTTCARIHIVLLAPYCLWEFPSPPLHPWTSRMPSMGNTSMGLSYAIHENHIDQPLIHHQWKPHVNPHSHPWESDPHFLVHENLVRNSIYYHWNTPLLGLFLKSFV